MKRAILDCDEEHKCTNAGTPSSSTMSNALLGLKARFHRAPAAVSCTSYKHNASSGQPYHCSCSDPTEWKATVTCQPGTHASPKKVLGTFYIFKNCKTV